MRASIAPMCVLALLFPDLSTSQTPPAHRLHVPPGFTVELVAGPPLVEHPVMANFDPRGRLFVAETAGQNLKKDDLLKELPNLVRVLEPADEQGRFHKSRVFAGKMSLPMGALWHRNALYVASPPSLWKLEDTKSQGVADRRTELVTKFGFTGNAADIHGPFLGPDGWLYWCDGRHGHNIRQPDGTTLQGKAARIFRCKHDGSGVEIVCGGGMDNPVEIAFTPEGEPFFTVNIIHTQPARNDAICFALEGAVYPWHDVYKEFPRTGDLMPTIENLGWVAPSGLMRYQSSAFGKEYEGNLFSCQFNRSRIQRHVVTREGAGFKMKTEDFLTSDDKNFHPTDVLEDTDGSLLVIDTGGWFRIGCPTSKIEQPEIKGAIYRVRKTGTTAAEDPRGLKISWDSCDLWDLLNDSRWTVRERAIEELAARPASLHLIAQKLPKEESNLVIRNAVWALCRMEGTRAREITRGLLLDKDLSVKLAAIHATGMHRDEKAFASLERLLANEEHPAVRRQAATALARLANKRAAPALMEAVKTAGDRFLEHALLYALIQIGNADAVAPYLNDDDSKLQRAALIVLDQMPGDHLAREQITPLLNTQNAALLKATLDVIASRPSWGAEITGLLRDWLGAPTLDAGRRENLRDLLVGLSSDGAIQKLTSEALANQATPAATRLVVLESVARAPLVKTPPAWITELGRALQHPDDRVVQQAIVALRARNVSDYTNTLHQVAHDSHRRPETRLAALGVAAGQLKQLDSSLFDFVVGELAANKEPLQRLAAAQALAQGKLDDAQRGKLTAAVVQAGALEMPHLLATFESSTNDDVGRALVKSLERAPGLASLTPTSLERTFRGFSKSVRDQASELSKRLTVDVVQQKAKLDELEPSSKGGDIELGRNVFYGPKASCAACHAVGGKGSVIGPELSKIGAIRSARDLLESLVFPSSSFARGFEPYVVETKAGKTHNGIIARESADSLVLVNADRHEVRVPRSDIESLTPARVSIMPQGLDAQLSRQELRDLMAYLQSLR